MNITLAPLSLPCPPSEVRAFYSALEKSPISTFVLGETVCLQRNHLSLEEWIELGERLVAAGHTVRLASPILVDSDEALALTQAICTQSPFLVEAGDTTAAAILKSEGKPFATSPTLSIYHAHALHEWVSWGASYWSIPTELSRDNLSHLRRVWRRDFPHHSLPEMELTVYGYPMLSCSARCFTAQAYSRPRHACQQVCYAHPEGITIRSLEKTPLFRMNGTQIESGEPYNLLPFLSEMASLSISMLRISPSSLDVSVLKKLVEFLHTRPKETPPLFQHGTQGYWLGEAGMSRFDSA